MFSAARAAARDNEAEDGLKRLSALERRFAAMSRPPQAKIIHIEIKKLGNSIGSVRGSATTGPVRATVEGPAGNTCI